MTNPSKAEIKARRKALLARQEAKNSKPGKQSPSASTTPPAEVTRLTPPRKTSSPTSYLPHIQAIIDEIISEESSLERQLNILRKISFSTMQDAIIIALSEIPQRFRPISMAGKFPVSLQSVKHSPTHSFTEITVHGNSTRRAFTYEDLCDNPHLDHLEVTPFYIEATYLHTHKIGDLLIRVQYFQTYQFDPDEQELLASLGYIATQTTSETYIVTPENH